MSRVAGPRLLATLAVALLAVSGPASLAGQQPVDLEKSRQRLEQIRAERDRLRQNQERLQGQVRDAGRELDNLERQRETANRIVNELERQIGGLGGQLDNTSVQLTLTEDNLADRRAVLERRLVDIYKRGRSTHSKCCWPRSPFPTSCLATSTCSSRAGKIARC